MKWFDNWFANKCKQAWENESTKPSGRLIAVTEDSSINSDPMRISLYRASGGLIVEVRTYDRQKDRNNSQLHIIPSDADVAESLSKILTLESLRI